jgi:hypothetical protein
MCAGRKVGGNPGLHDKENRHDPQRGHASEAEQVLLLRAHFFTEGCDGVKAQKVQ